MGTIFTTLSGWQATPFFVWGMYSEKEDTSSLRPVIKITINDSMILDPAKGFTDANRFFLTSPLQLYILMKKNREEDPTKLFLKRKLGSSYSSIESLAEKILNRKNQYDSFLNWYAGYLEQTTGILIKNYTIELLKAGYTDKNKIEIYSSELIDTWKQ